MCHIVYRDDCLLVLDKPSGLLAVPGRGPDLQDCLSARRSVMFLPRWSCIAWIATPRG